MAAAGVYVFVYIVWVVAGWGSAYAQMLVGDLVLLPLALGAAACAWRASTHPDLDNQTRRAWKLLAVAYLCNLSGEFMWFVYEIVLDMQPYPSLADVGYLLFYPFMLWGLVSFPRVMHSRKEYVTFWLDTSTVLVATGIVIWYFILRPIVQEEYENALTMLLAVAYPLGDLAMFFGISTILLRHSAEHSRAALYLLGSGALCFFAADLGYSYMSLQGAYESGSWPVLAWTVSYYFFMGSAHHQYRRAAPLAADADTVLPRIRPFTIVPYLAVACAYGLLVAVARELWDHPIGGLIIGAVVLTGVVVARQIIAVRENVRLLGAQALQQSEARFRALAQHSSDVIVIVDADANIQYHTPSLECVFGYRSADILAVRILDLVHPDDRAHAQAFFRQTLARPGVSPPVEWRMRHMDGSWHYAETIGNNLLHDPNVGGVVLNTRDVSERKGLEQQLAHQAFHDALTRLPNRALFTDRLEHALVCAQDSHQHIAVLFLDLDNFKFVNDSLGHAAGDDLLIEVAQRLRQCVRPGDTLARLGGDEFTILLEAVGDEYAAEAVAQRIWNALQTPFTIDGQVVFTSASIGIALSTAACCGADELLRAADIAMYRAKMGGKAHAMVFDESMTTDASQRLALETDLRRALERDEFVVVYQPLVHLASQRVLGAEALVRWHHPTRGVIPPNVFIPLAEETGLILPLGRWVIVEACRQARTWHSDDPASPPCVSVNLSARQFRHPQLVGDIAAVLRETGLPAHRLTLEITESMLMAQEETTLRSLTALKQLGIKLAIDDFGTGYSSLAYLKRFPIDILKIDRSFVERIEHDAGDSAIVHTIVTLAKTLNLAVTGEGIETAAQLAHLRALDCDVGQGYLFSKPVPAQQIAAVFAAPVGVPLPLAA